MISSASTRPYALLPLSLLLLAGCAEATRYGLSTGTILSTVIRAADGIDGRMDSRAGSSSGSSAGAATRRLPRSPAPTAMAARVLTTADKYIGVPYTWGGNTPSTGFDCSGFTKYVFAAHGITLPRTAREQARAGQAITLSFDALRPGDILLFADPGEAISHVAIYVGSGEIVHSSTANGGVGYLDLNTSRGDWFVQNMVAARRLTAQRS